MIDHREINIDEIILLEENPRTITDADLSKLSADIKQDPNFLMQRPPLLNLKDGKLFCYAGTQRVKASREIGYRKIFCFVESNVPENIQKERMLKDNLHRGQWDKDKLLELGFDNLELEAFGFDEISLDMFGDDLDYPDELTAPKKDNPPTIKLTFPSAKEMARFQQALPIWLSENHFEDVNYSVSQGEI